MNLYAAITTTAMVSKPLTAGFDDPHGWILTLTAVSVVFGVLMLLWLIFGLLGKGFQRAEARRAAAAASSGHSAPDDRHSGPDDRHSGLVPESSPESAAIALALHLYLSETVHDAESYVITLKPASPENRWGQPGRNFRKTRKA